MVELAITMVISALIITAFVKGSEIISRAGLYKVVKEIQTYRAAIATYHVVYDYYPGDDPNASSNFTTVANGNGDGFIDWSSESYNADFAIIESKLMPLPVKSSYRVSAFRNNFYHPPTTCSVLNNADIGNNCHQLGSALDVNPAGLLPKEHMFIDSKLDDANPKTGKIRFRVIYEVTDETCGDENGYVLASKVAGCNLTYDITID